MESCQKVLEHEHLSQAVKWIKRNCKELLSPVVYHRESMAKVWRHGTLSRAPHGLCAHSQPQSYFLSRQDHLENNIVLDPLVGQWSVFTSEFGPVFQLNSVSEKQQELIKPFAS